MLEQELERTGFQALAYGLNRTTGQDFRPGHKAAAQHRVAAPLAEAGLSKADVRALAQRGAIAGLGQARLLRRASPRGWSTAGG